MLAAILELIQFDPSKLAPIAAAVVGAIGAVVAKNYSQAWTDALSILTILGVGGTVATMHADVAAVRRGECCKQ